MAITRMLLIFSSALGIILGLLFLAAGVYGFTSENLLKKYADKVDLHSVPKAAVLKRAMVNSLEGSGIVQTGAGILLIIGALATLLSALGILVGVADSRIYAKLVSTQTGFQAFVFYLSSHNTCRIAQFRSQVKGNELGSDTKHKYIAFDVLAILGFLALTLLLTVVNSAIEKPIQDRVVETLNRKFVSVVAVFENKASDAMAVTIIFNYIQLQFSCCGIRKVGDIRSSPRWRASPRSLAHMLKPEGSEDAASDDDGGKGSGKKKAAEDDESEVAEKVTTSNRVTRRKLLVVEFSAVPEWLKERIPAGATLPDGVNLPSELPEGLVLPKQFQLTEEILQSGTKVNKAFEKSLVLQTPVTCCQFKAKNFASTLNAKALVSGMVDPNCPFQAKNSMAVHNKTCYEKALSLLNQHSIFILIGGSAIGLYLSCNLGLAILILLRG